VRVTETRPWGQLVGFSCPASPAGTLGGRSRAGKSELRLVCLVFPQRETQAPDARGVCAKLGHLWLNSKLGQTVWLPRAKAASQGRNAESIK